MIVGITGGIGSGKSFVTNLLLEKPSTVYYHADEEAKKLMNTSQLIKSKVLEAFGEDAYTSNGLNRAYISNLVFNNQEQLQTLNAIVHPEVHKHFDAFIENHKNEIICYENAILFEIGSDKKCDLTILVDAPVEDRISRVMKRDQVTREAVENRIKNQWSGLKKGLLSNYIICNSSKKETKLQVDRIYNILTKKHLLVE